MALPARRRYRLAVDVGGTFVDVVLLDQESGGLTTAKVPSVPGEEWRGLVAGVAKALAAASATAGEVEVLLHGTTVATNTVLQRTGAALGLITTRGFRDVLEIGRQTRPRLYDFRARRPAPLVPRERRLEVEERVLPTGEVRLPLDTEGAAACLRDLAAAGVEGVVVGLLHSYANPAHERAIREIARRVAPRLPVFLSSEVLPEIREYERLSTTALNAYVAPALARYLSRLADACQGIGLECPILVMQSSGGVMTPALASSRSAVHALLSGPAGGVLGARFLGERAGYRNLLAVDMGGTSFDVSLIHEGQVGMRVDATIDGLPVRVPMFDITTLGAGGGSIAWVDQGQLLRVGPRSAGARPGPACYGLGGEQPTVTDANLVLGRIDPEARLGHEVAVSLARARAAVARHVGEPLGLGVEEAAAGIIRVVNAAMVRGIRVMSVQRGLDPRQFVLMALGGSGPLHAAGLAREMGVPEVVVPAVPGLACALGLLSADLERRYVAALLAPLTPATEARLEAGFRALEEQAREEVRRESGADAPLELLRGADLRYRGQGHELLVEGASAAELAQRFHQQHRQLFGYAEPEAPVEVVAVRVVARVRLPHHELAPRRACREREAPPQGRRLVWVDGAWQPAAIYGREELAPGMRFRGPAVVEQMDATTFLPGGQARVDEFGNLILRPGARA